MEKYEYMTAIWDFSPASKIIRLINSKGEVGKYGINFSISNPNLGDQEFMQLCDYLGNQGWELFNVTSIDYGRGNFTYRGFFRRKISGETLG